MSCKQLKYWLMIYSCIMGYQMIQSDHMIKFTSHFWRASCGKLNTRVGPSSSFHPNRTVKLEVYMPQIVSFSLLLALGQNFLTYLLIGSHAPSKVSAVGKWVCRSGQHGLHTVVTLWSTQKSHYPNQQLSFAVNVEYQLYTAFATYQLHTWLLITITYIKGIVPVQL